MILSLAAFLHLATACDPVDAATTLASVATVESKLNPWAIHDNTSGLSYAPDSRNDAERIATDLIVAKRHSVDVGLMQINSDNLPSVGLSIPDAFDACHSIVAGSSILRAGYRQALKAAISRYNTGSPVRGFANGYVGRVEAAAANLPAIQVATLAEPVPPPSVEPLAPVEVVDMLHSNEVATSSPDSVADLLADARAEQAAQVNIEATQRTLQQFSAVYPWPTVD